MKPRHRTLLISNDIALLPESEQFAVFAVAYLDSAERLCRVLARSYRQATYERGSVVLFLTAHAVELFLKGAILRRAPQDRFDHELEQIHNRYCKLYPAKRYKFEMPFSTEYCGMTKRQIQSVKKLSPKTNQLYRYPQNREGKPWPGMFSFEPIAFLETLISLRVQFDRLLKEYGPSAEAKMGQSIFSPKL